jgi:translation elongation factor EF-Tu-like GTPase
MGFWSRLLGRNEFDSTVTDALAANEAQRAVIAATASTPRPAAGSFLLTVEDVFSITGRGLVVTGRVTAGTVSVGDAVLVESPGMGAVPATVTGVEAFRKKLTTATAGQMVGLLLDGVSRDQLTPGSVISRS